MTAPIEERLAAAGLPPLPRLCWLEIDEAALADNLRLVRRHVGPGVELNAVVKADAYGHGCEAAARAFVAAGADRLCVASLDEALHLRAVGIAAPLLVMFAVPPQHVRQAAEERVDLTLGDEDGARRLLGEWATASAGAEVGVQLEVETGLGRAGLRPERVASIHALALATPAVRVTGIWTHLAAPDDRAFTAGQLAEFERAVEGMRVAGLPIPPRHVAATGGLLANGVPAWEGVRPGLLLYGLLPAGLPIGDEARGLAAAVRPAMALKCRALRVETVSAGTPIGYGGRWRAEHEALIATLPVGYGDGWARAYTPGAAALVRGRRVPLVGTVAMDAVAADVTGVVGVTPADEFVLLGEQEGQRIGADDLARTRNTIAWEVVTSMAQRLPRVYHASSVLLGVRTLGGEIRSTRGPGTRG